MARTDDPQFMLRIHAPSCDCFANCWPCPNHDFCASRNGRIVVSCTCTESITQICGSNISFADRQSPWARFNGPFAVYRLITARCPNILQLETCRTYRGIQTVGRRWLLDCGCLISLICCEDPRPDGELFYRDTFEDMNVTFSGLGGFEGVLEPLGGGERADSFLGPPLQASEGPVPPTMGHNVINEFRETANIREAQNGPGRSVDHPIELESDDENVKDAPPPRTARRTAFDSLSGLSMNMNVNGGA